MDFKNKVVYQIYPKSYMDSNNDGIGDLQGIISKLDYIKDLGVDYVWLSPVNKSPQHDNGYDISDYYDIDPMFGTLEDYKELIREANSRGMKMMLDLVLNHTSDEHEWFQKALAGDEYYKDFYIWRDESNEIETYFAKNAWTYSSEVGQYYFHLFDTHQPDLNWKNENVRREIYKMVNFWIDLGVEGFRLDVIDLIGKEPDNYITAKGPNFLKYLRELSSETFGDKLLTVGECWGASIEEATEMCKGGLTQVFHFEQLTTANINGDKWNRSEMNFEDIINIIEKWQTKYNKSQNWVMNNHDMPRLQSVWFNTDKRYEVSTMLITLFGLLDGTIYIYQGEEIGMVNTHKSRIEDFNDVETHNEYAKMVASGLDEIEVMRRINKVSRDNPRVPMNWDSSKNRGFSQSKPWIGYNIDTTSVVGDLCNEKSIYEFYKTLIRFKKDNYDDIICKMFEDISIVDNVIYYKRDKMRVVCNLNNKKVPRKYKENIVMSNYQMSECLMPFEANVIINKEK